jgi:FkbM family methyltransferase
MADAAESTRASRGPLRRLRRALTVTIIEAFFSAFERTSRLFARVSPTLARILETTLARAHATQEAVIQGQTLVVTMVVGDVSFKLALLAGNRAARQDYPPLADGAGVYEPVAVACLARLLGRMEEPAFMDIGAFMGYFACYVAALQGNSRDVWAVESNPEFAATVRRSAAANGFSRLRVIEAALSDRRETVTLAGNAVLPGRVEGPKRRIVEALTLDEICARDGLAPRIVKIDVNGAEGKVLRGMARALHEHVEFLLLELHSLSLYAPHSPGVSRVELLRSLWADGFYTFVIAGHRLEARSGAARSLEHGRFAWLPLTPETVAPLLFDRPLDILVLASKIPDPAVLLGPAVDIDEAIG